MRQLKHTRVISVHFVVLEHLRRLYVHLVVFLAIRYVFSVHIFHRHSTSRRLSAETSFHHIDIALVL